MRLKLSRWKLFLILILAVVLLHILIIKIFIIGNSDEKNIKTEDKKSVVAAEKISSMPEPQLPANWRKK